MIQNDHTPSVSDHPGIHPTTVIESPELVAVERRRRLLTHLQRELESESESTTVDELVDALCDDDADVGSTNGDANPRRDSTVNREPTDAVDRRELRIYLYHVDLPILEDAGLIEYDAENRRVEIVR
ncbi:hypothetical protein OB955_01340 [Halobacteria archaeon AArc-m2/3/4]|uniref:DUF7344 domain-containing protein n=1 Tax=Natronoglomus mannanivorans TaxID=2979990 RepID=A0AAP3E0K2_9EURY|nr:hypothetical protein [Halobacteria archaeon AArc-xg1-1]MCU4971384.1 hypothetical protein [Halobacteria archaeon AArc-m2/3/4]